MLFLIFKYKIYIILNISFKLHTYTYDLDTTMIPMSVSFSSHIWEVEIKNKTEEGIQRKVKVAIGRKTKREKKANGKSKEKLTNEKKYMNRESENECIDKRNNEL